MTEERACKTCGRILPINGFYYTHKYKGRTYYSYTCKTCTKFQRAVRRSAARVTGKATCNTCGQTKRATEFYLTSSGHLNAKCKPCYNAAQRAAYAAAKMRPGFREHANERDRAAAARRKRARIATLLDPVSIRRGQP